MGWLDGRQLFEYRGDGGGQHTQPLELLLVGGELILVRQFLVHQQVRDFLELALRGDIENVVAAIMQVVAGSADGAQRGIAGRDAGQGHGFLRFECARGLRARGCWSLFLSFSE